MIVLTSFAIPAALGVTCAILIGFCDMQTQKDFSDQMRTGMLNVVWPLPREEGSGLTT